MTEDDMKKAHKIFDDMGDTVTISKEEYLSLVRDSHLLNDILGTLSDILQEHEIMEVGN